MEGWEEVAAVVTSSQPFYESTTTLSGLIFDRTEELIWTSDSKGHVESFYSSHLRRYVSFRAHQDSSAFQILSHPKGILSIGSGSLRLTSRRGLCKFNLKHEGLEFAHCMDYTSRANTDVIIGFSKPGLLRANVDRGTIIQQYSSDSSYSLIRGNGRVVCAATPRGQVELLDPNSMQVIKIFTPHSGAVADMDYRDNMLLTCGYSQRSMGYILDPLVNIYDLRAMKPIAPIPFPSGAAFVRMHPKLSSFCIILSQTGQIQFVDYTNPANVFLNQASIQSYVTAMDISSSGKYLSFADGDGIIHLWSNSGNSSSFNEFSAPTEFPDASNDTQPIHIDDDTPLNVIGMPYYRDELLSAWDSSQRFNVGKPDASIDPQIFKSMKMVDFVGYAPFNNNNNNNNNNKNSTRKRYQVDQDTKPDSDMIVPLFRSERSKLLLANEGNNNSASTRDNNNNSNSNNNTRNDQAAAAIRDPFSDDEDDRDPMHGGNEKVSKAYRKLDIKYSKFGVEDFDFDYYNRTIYAGLENHLDNAYCNALLQLFRYTPLIYNVAMHHTAKGCDGELCLLCELGFLFDMLDKANGQHSKAFNFSKTLSSIPQAHALGLIDDESITQSIKPVGSLIQSFTRFLLERIGQDHSSTNPNFTFHDICGLVYRHSTFCNSCQHESLRQTKSFALELIQPQPSFTATLQESIERVGQTRAWCDSCHRYKIVNTRKVIEKLPPLLIINMDTTSSYWRQPGWIVPEITCVVANGRLTINDNRAQQKQQQQQQTTPVDSATYELVGIVVEISENGSNNSSNDSRHRLQTNSSQDDDCHLVSLIRLPPDASKRDPTKSIDDQPKIWYLFNDFLVKSVSNDEALNFQVGWKRPLILCYQRIGPNAGFDNSWKDNLNLSALFEDGQDDENNNLVVKLTPQEVKEQEKLIVGIDSEFVVIEKHQTEVRSDGTKFILRPSKLSLARVSVLRGNKSSDSRPFIDDYIATRETVCDYLTEYSGIEPGDITRGISKKSSLVNLRIAYRKLWLLLQLGAIFVGHGLTNDFRTINIKVPPNQVIDTVDIFFIPSRQRRLSLKFLAWFLLNEDIQGITHDSIEDALTALKLYRKYLDLIKDDNDPDRFQLVLNQVYDQGRMYNFRPPPQM